MLPVNTGGHAAYQNFIIENLRKYYPNPDALPQSTGDIIERFWLLDLSYTDESLRSKYPIWGARPHTLSCMQRSYLLSIDFKVYSLTDWAAQLKINPLYAILSGSEFDYTPGIEKTFQLLVMVLLVATSARECFYSGYDLYFLPDFHVSRKHGCSYENPCSDSKYGRTVHLAMKDNPRLINFRLVIAKNEK